MPRRDLGLRRLGRASTLLRRAGGLQTAPGARAARLLALGLGGERIIGHDICLAGGLFEAEGSRARLRPLAEEAETSAPWLRRPFRDGTEVGLLGIRAVLSRLAHESIGHVA